MNNSKMWLVVKPTVGVPLFLSAVAVGSFAVHVAVLSNTTWVADFLSGKELGAMESAALKVDTPDVAKVAYTGTDGSIVVEMPDGTLAQAKLSDATLASVLTPTE